MEAFHAKASGKHFDVAMGQSVSDVGLHECQLSKVCKYKENFHADTLVAQ